MGWENIAAERAAQIAVWLWDVLLVVWLLMWFGKKSTKKSETPSERLQHIAPVLLAFWLLFGNDWTVLNARVFPGLPAILWAGLFLTALGVGIGVWARLSLGGNWSGTVTLKRDHELVRKGLYRWIRHPIYSGILLAFIGTAVIEGQVRGWIGLAILWTAFYIKARREESFLRQEFGEGFEEHLRHTGMFLPKLT